MKLLLKTGIKSITSLCQTHLFVINAKLRLPLMAYDGENMQKIFSKQQKKAVRKQQEGNVN